MPRVVITDGAVQGLERCRQFLAENNPRAAQRAGQAIEQHFALLEANADIGRPLPETDLREMIIGFGNSGYVALYRADEDGSTVYVLAVRHQREAGY